VGEPEEKGRDWLHAADELDGVGVRSPARAEPLAAEDPAVVAQRDERVESLRERVQEPRLLGLDGAHARRGVADEIDLEPDTVHGAPFRHRVRRAAVRCEELARLLLGDPLLGDDAVA
jgi:hypothetical protein